MDDTQHRDTDRGQTTILMIGVMGSALVAMIAVALVGEALVHRQRARNAADAIALANATDVGVASELAGWYESQGVMVAVAGNRAWTQSGPSQAAAWAERITDQVETAPVLRAVVARIEQLRGRSLTSVVWGRDWFELNPEDAQVVWSVADEFGLCERHGLALTQPRRFALC